MISDGPCRPARVGRNRVAVVAETELAQQVDHQAHREFRDRNAVNPRGPAQPDAAALEQCWSNEWVMDVMSLIPYQTLDTSVWKVSAFTDYVSTFFDRCTWQAPTPVPKDLTWHFSYGSDDWVAPESLPTFRYVGSDTTAGINYLPCAALDTACEAERRKKLRSCPIGRVQFYLNK